MKKRNIINLIVGLALFGMAIYTLMGVINGIDFKSLKIIVNETENTWQFLAFIPILITMFAGALLTINGLINNKVLSITSLVLCIVLLLFIQYDLYGFVTILKVYEDLMSKLNIALIASTVIILIEIIITSIKNKKVAK